MSLNNNSIVYTKAKEFSINMINLCRYIRINRREYSLADQLLRASTSIGANIAEASQAQSKKDFIAKMYIAMKEAGESSYWLEVLHDANIITSQQYEFHDKACDELLRILTSILKTTKQNLENTSPQ
ncbi:MAG: four helix bundle protein [Muribaculaceae bacterium]|nr:four helix bundle protein [Muribaculaceae bacterium]